MASRIACEWAVQVGVNPDGMAETRSLGYEIEDNYGNGNITTRLMLALDVLNPVLFALVRPHVAGKSGYAVAVRREFAKRYKDQGTVPAEEGGTPGVVSRVTKEWALQVGTNTSGGPEARSIGFEVEDEDESGGKTTRMKLFLDVLSPVFYQLVKAHLPAGAAHVYAVREVVVRRQREGGPPAEEVAAANGAGG